MIRYEFSYDNPQNHFIKVRLTLTTKQSETLLKLPAWRPGRYQIQNFAKNIKGLTIRSEQGDLIPLKKTNKNTWLVSTAPGIMTAEYSYYAFKMDAGNSWLDEEQLYINFINCALYTPDHLGELCQIDLKIPNDYRVATGLRSISNSSYQCNNFYELVDSPLFASSSLRNINYTVDGHRFNVWVQGELPKTDDEVISDFRPFTELQMQVMKGFPCPEYHFLIQSLPYKHYHGVEHLNSTVITIGPSSELATPERYRELLGVSSHELFHTWNVIRMRPSEMSPYDFERENYHETGFVTEGVTTYYGDLFLKRSGVFSTAEYLTELNKLLKRHYDNEGRKHYSIAESSYDLWLDGYERGIPGRKVSIYNEGALAALILDLKIRLKTNNVKSLDDVVRGLWTEHERKSGGYSYQDYQNVAEAVYGESLQGYFDQIISGTSPYEEELAPLFEAFGMNFEFTMAEKPEECVLGLRLIEYNGRFIIDQIAPGSPAEKALSAKDEILSINGAPFKGVPDIDGVLLVNLTINRFGRMVEVSLPPGDNNYFSVYQVALSEQLTEDQKLNRTKWLDE